MRRLAASSTDGSGAGGPCDVLVVGAGPVGLALACELRRHGVSCRVVDSNDGPTPLNESRALGLQARTLEVFHHIGVIDAVLESARKVHGVSAYSEGRRVIHLSFDFEGLETPYPFIAILPQSRTERVLLDRLAALGGSVERGTTLEGLAQDAAGVTARLVDGSGTPREARARWVVGCDGARSAVRKALGLGFEGGEYEERFLLADVHVDWPFPTDEATIVLTPEGPLGAFPLPGEGRWRLIDTTGMIDTNDPKAIVDRFRELVQAHAAPGATVDDPAWTSSFHIHRRVVDRYREGRCFVAGDAAHLHSPAGGQGLNTGVQDAFNLAWKLAAVARGHSGEALLDTYDAERRPVGREVLRGTDLMTRMATLRNEVARHLRNKLFGLLAEFDFVRRRTTVGVSELGIAYRHSPIVAQDRPHGRGTQAFDHGPRPGDRVPDVPIGDGGRLFDALTTTRHVLLLFPGSAATGDAARSEAIRTLDACRERVTRDFSDRVAPVLVSRPGVEIPWGGDLLADDGLAAHARFGAEAACLYLVRPDGYVGYRAQPPDPEKLAEYLGRVFDGAASA